MDREVIERKLESLSGSRLAQGREGAPTAGAPPYTIKPL